jgi:nucleotide-binding universal stress UspA family protein
MNGSTTRIVVGLNSSDHSRRGLDWAAAEAASRHLPLYLVHALVPPPVGHRMTERDWTARVTEAEDLLTQARARAKEAGAGEVSTEIVARHAAPTLVEISHAAAMVVLGAPGHSPLHDLWAGSVSRHVCRHAHCPVVVVRPPADIPGTRVLVGVDGTPGNAQAVRFAAEAAARWGVPLVAVYGWHDHSPATLGSASPAWSGTLDRIQDGERLIRTALAGCIERYPDLKVTPEALPLAPGRALVDGSEHASLVVVGGAGRPGLPLLGSVSDAVLRQAWCPVAVVR